MKTRFVFLVFLVAVTNLRVIPTDRMSWAGLRSRERSANQPTILYGNQSSHWARGRPWGSLHVGGSTAGTMQVQRTSNRVEAEGEAPKLSYQGALIYHNFQTRGPPGLETSTPGHTSPYLPRYLQVAYRGALPVQVGCQGPSVSQIDPLQHEPSPSRARAISTSIRKSRYLPPTVGFVGTYEWLSGSSFTVLCLLSSYFSVPPPVLSWKRYALPRSQSLASLWCQHRRWQDHRLHHLVQSSTTPGSHQWTALPEACLDRATGRG